MRTLKENWRELIAFAAIMWAVMFCVAWIRRNSCETMDLFPCIVAATLRFGADLVMFRWVDTTLAAGLLAVVAASVVFINSAIERERALRDKADEKQAALYASLSTIRLAMKRLGGLRMDGASTERIDAATIQLESHLAAISSEALNLSNVLMFILMEIEGAPYNAIYSLTWASEFILSQPERYFRNGKFDVHRLNLVNSARPKLNWLTPAHQERLRDWINWES